MINNHGDIAELREEVLRQGGTITTIEPVPLGIEEQMLRRALRFPEYIEQERLTLPGQSTIAEISTMYDTQKDHTCYNQWRTQ